MKTTTDPETAWHKFKQKATKVGFIAVGVIFLIIVIIDLSSDDVAKVNASTPIVFNSEFDGSVSQVKSFLDKYLNDPSSYSSVLWGPVILKPDSTFVVVHQYRAANGYGAIMLYNQVFYLDKYGTVTSWNDDD